MDIYGHPLFEDIYVLCMNLRARHLFVSFDENSTFVLIECEGREIGRWVGSSNLRRRAKSTRPAAGLDYNLRHEWGFLKGV